MVSPAKGQIDVALFAAARSGDVQKATRLLAAGANVNYRGGLFAERPLHVASAKGDIAMVRTLLQHGASVDAVCERRNTPLHEAVLANAADVVVVLRDAGADVCQFLLFFSSLLRKTKTVGTPQKFCQFQHKTIGQREKQDWSCPPRTSQEETP